MGLALLSEQLAQPVAHCEFIFVGAPGGAEVSREALDAIQASVAAVARGMRLAAP